MIAIHSSKGLEKPIYESLHQGPFAHYLYIVPTTLSGDLVIGPTDIAYLPAQEQLSLEQTVRAALTSRGIGASGYPQIARFDV